MINLLHKAGMVFLLAVIASLAIGLLAIYVVLIINNGIPAAILFVFIPLMVIAGIQEFKIED